ncbi:replication restart DNA helicase PriA [Paenimyroides ummariense]|uniref:Replication restart protein PriA n=1 Tax=Paenimyroides ummariense TaxID=913024 RepID=A0A1I5ADJ9_9FLAO|nr:primosomal protein N' [Paenimyroides ummariense]SFN60601.1 replication restart DNA helicase PriA [Paenimyroides ummariense]
MDYFIDVIVPIAVTTTFTYRVSQAEYNFLQQGMRVAVPFGKRLVYTALVLNKHNQKPQLYEAKDIHTIIDEKPIVTQIQIEFWQWISQYYMCSLGEVYKAALPSAFLLESETILSLNRDLVVDLRSLTDDEFLLYEAFEQQPILRFDEVQNILNKKKVFGVIDELLKKDIIYLNQHIHEKYKPKLVKYVALHDNYKEESKLINLLDNELKTEKQRALVLKYFQLSTQKATIELKELLKEAEVSTAIFSNLEKKQIFTVYTLAEDRVQFTDAFLNDIQFTEAQTTAIQSIKNQFEKHDVTLLNAVTGAGKTEIYIKLIQECIEKNQQALFLVPEIGLTTQLVQRLTAYFGNKVAVYNSKYSENERVEVYQHVLNHTENAQVVIGSRSSVFLPFKNLQLIIVDEEHEASYKQVDPAPRFHTRDAAIVLAKMFQAKVLLGSATPSLESYYNSYQQKYGYVELNQRFTNVQLPEIVLVDLKEARRKKEINGIFSIKLIDAITEALYNGEQVLLFQNRRGYSPVLECLTCGNVPHCTSCDVSLTYYKRQNYLKCHYCGYTMSMPTKCHSCHSTELTTKGLGTEQIEDALRSIFPNKQIARMDQDTTRGKFAFERLIDGFKNREIDIMVGTQMLAKGLDFDNVSLVGIMNADSMLTFPDFRAYERAYQLMTQVAGRAGRKNKQGKVLIQTYNPYHNTIQQVTQNDYKAMFKEQMYERLNFKYPPFYRLIRLQMKHTDFNKVKEASTWLATNMRNNINGILVLGPQEPSINRIRNQYIQIVLIKLPLNKPVNVLKTAIQKSINSLETIGMYKSVKTTISVDFY